MHDSPRVSVEARRRVREAVDTLGYTPNALARGLATRSTHTIGVLVNFLADPFWAEVVRGIEDAAQEAGYAVLIAGSYEDARREEKAMDLFRQKRVDGVVVGASSGGSRALPSLAVEGMPVVFINDEHIEPEDTDGGHRDQAPHADGRGYHVAGDDCHGARLAIEHLLGLGHQRISYIGAAGRASALRRLQGFRQAMREAGCPADEAVIMSTGDRANDGELGAFRLLTARPRPTALFCYDDMTALGALRAARALDLHAPRDFSVVGFDDIPIAAYLEPSLTTVRQPMHEMGARAMRIVIELLRGDEAPDRVIMPGELVVRASSGPAPSPSP
jgi:DNA-binding LacI/PurR family transcriptional regulator